MIKNQYFGGILLSLVLLSGCKDLATDDQLDPVVFDGITTISQSGVGTFIVEWQPPEFGEVESYEVYVLNMEEDGAVADSSTAGQPPAAALALAEGEDEGGLQSAGDSTAVEFELDKSPAVAGKLVGLVDASETSYLTETLEAGRYAFQVKVLMKDGRRDDSNDGNIVLVNSVQTFLGLQVADVIGTNLYLEWLPAPGIREGDEIRYTAYKGQAMEESVAVTSENFVEIDIEKEPEGATVYFGVRFTNGQGVEEQNSVVLPVVMPVRDANYLGCVAATGIGSDRVKVEFEWPSERYESVKIFREQQEVFVAFRSDVKTDESGAELGPITEFVDIGLQEGENYTYTCQGVTGKDIVIGTNTVNGSPLTRNAPTFDGIRVAGIKATTVDAALVKWGVATGVPADSFKIFATPGLQVDWDAEPVATIPPNTLQYSVEGLGDDMYYAFGVRACTETCDEATDVCEEVCDLNVEQEVVGLTPDLGPPKTQGPNELGEVRNGVVYLTAPWKHQDGGIAKRVIHYKIGGEATDNIEDYRELLSVAVEDPSNPPVEISLPNFEIENKQTYHFLVVDVDRNGNSNENRKPSTVNAGDVSSPDFSGIKDLIGGPEGQEETSLIAVFDPINPQNIDPDGASHYLFFIKEGQRPDCGKQSIFEDEEVVRVETEAKDFLPAPGAQFTLTGLKAKTSYFVCMQARDEAGNISEAEPTQSAWTSDSTPPEFNSIQNLTYDKEASSVKVDWIPSRSDDVSFYNVHFYVTDKNGTVKYDNVIRRDKAEFADSALFPASVIGFGSEDFVNVYVNACDFFSQTGSSNCTEQYTLDSAMQIQLEDVSPPDGFDGIATFAEQINTVEGTVTVTWREPNNLDYWPDYRGFKVYHLDPDSGDLILLKDCPCVSSDCSDRRLSCPVTGLDVYRTYDFHVRAYDSKQNLTLLEPPGSYSMSVQTIDLTAPIFNPNLTSSMQTGNVEVRWKAANDNQYEQEPGAQITFTVYRIKEDAGGNGFAAPTNPSADGIAVLEDFLQDPLESEFNFLDEEELESGAKYFYTVCATDGSGNENCPGSVTSIEIPDTESPVIPDGSFVSNKLKDDKVWNLTWDMTDNESADGSNLIPILYMVASDEEELSLNPETIGEMEGVTQITGLGIGDKTRTGLYGPDNVDKYLHYLLVVSDPAGTPPAYATLTLKSNNYSVIEEVIPNEGDIGGGKLVVIKGKGFHNNSAVKINGVDCATTTFITENYMTCVTPASAGSATGERIVRVDTTIDLPGDDDFNQFVDSDGNDSDTTYTYCVPGVNCNNPCNQIVTHTNNPNFTRIFDENNNALGLSETTPYLICNKAELEAIADQPHNRHYELGDNIDLGGSAAGDWTPLYNTGQSTFRGTFNGNGFAIANLYIDKETEWANDTAGVIGDAADYLGVFRRITGGSKIRNLGIVGAEVIGDDYVGSLVGYLVHSIDRTQEENHLLSSLVFRQSLPPYL